MRVEDEFKPSWLQPTEAQSWLARNSKALLAWAGVVVLAAMTVTGFLWMREEQKTSRALDVLAQSSRAAAAPLPVAAPPVPPLVTLPPEEIKKAPVPPLVTLPPEETRVATSAAPFRNVERTPSIKAIVNKPALKPVVAAATKPASKPATRLSLASRKNVAKPNAAKPVAVAKTATRGNRKNGAIVARAPVQRAIPYAPRIRPPVMLSRSDSRREARELPPPVRKRRCETGELARNCLR